MTDDAAPDSPSPDPGRSDRAPSDGDRFEGRPLDTAQGGSPPRVFAGPQTWAAIRESYLAGVSAPTLERRYGVKANTIWQRAKRQGWLHASGPEHPAPALEPLFDPWDRPADPQPERTARDAAAAVDRAMREGRLDEAVKLARIAATMGVVARRGVL